MKSYGSISLRCRRRGWLRIFAALICLFGLSTAVAAHISASANHHRRHSMSKTSLDGGLDRSGKARKGKASYYSRSFYRKKMSDGTRMNPQSNAAASKTLPLGTRARVKNLENGNSDVVRIRDRGPYVKGRIVDVSPKTADKLGMKKDGTALVEVKPIDVPPLDGSGKPGAGTP